MQQNKGNTVSIFLINGINSVLGWNAVLAASDYFKDSFLDYNIYSFLPIPLYAGNLTVGFTYHMLSNKFKYVNLIIVGNTIVSVALAAIITVALTMKQQVLGFALLLLSSYLIGLGANLSQLTFFAMINYLSKEVVSRYTVGLGLSGLLITLIRVIILAVSGADNTSIAPIIIYFSIAILFNTFDMFLNIHFCKSEVYHQKIEKFIVYQNQNIDTLIPQKYNTAKSPSPQMEQIEQQNYFVTLYQTCMTIFPYPFIIMLTFTITFILYPGPTLSKTFDDVNVSWSVIIFLLVYHIGDTLGRYFSQIKDIFNIKSLQFLLVGRLIFFFPITIMANKSDLQDPMMNNYVFPYVNILFFSFTKGFCINASFIMAFKVCPIRFKKYAGVLCGLTLQIGIMLGIILQIPYAYLIGISS